MLIVFYLVLVFLLDSSTQIYRAKSNEIRSPVLFPKKEAPKEEPVDNNLDKQQQVVVVGKIYIKLCYGRKYIAVNFTDGMFRGMYNGKPHHVADIAAVLSRAWSTGVDRSIVTGGSLEESKEALAIAQTDGRFIHSTLPLAEFDDSGDPVEHFNPLLSLAKEGVEEGKVTIYFDANADNSSKVVSIGECGLDYDRLHFCPDEIQKKYFEKQFELAYATKLPMFLHMRAAAEDFCNILVQNRHSEEELSVLPRHTRVIVTKNNRTKSVLVGLQGVVKNLLVLVDGTGCGSMIYLGAAAHFLSEWIKCHVHFLLLSKQLLSSARNVDVEDPSFNLDVYERLIQKGKKPGFFQLLATQTVSAVWHGIYVI
ncbi:putative deoxyribonuclease tatdn1 [Phtheirospermum japonicum]|uniref:Putative deoxyribonuclease tatdn1 n=1 Tax=Phtheirospermum japonicum TaxID=374723 RepID=A0A830BI87_9LAMI|nr:putative deoxyribonuclease tatdn1 [Phtheirospermum japonicum]